MKINIELCWLLGFLIAILIGMIIISVHYRKVSEELKQEQRNITIRDLHKTT